MRSKLLRWEVPVFPRARAERALRLLPRPRTLVPPRVMAAVIRTWWNGWVTARRFQQRCGSRCIFGCGAGEDSVEHYSMCKVLWAFSAGFLGMQPAPHPAQRRAAFLLLDGTQVSDCVLTRSAVRMAAAYFVHCRVRHVSASCAAAAEMLPQAAREAVRGHPRATAALDGWWR